MGRGDVDDSVFTGSPALMDMELKVVNSWITYVLTLTYAECAVHTYNFEISELARR